MWEGADAQTRERQRAGNPVQKSISKEIASSSSKPLRFKRTNKPPILKSCAIFEEDEEPALPEDPQIASPKDQIKNLRKDVRFLRGQLDDSKIKVKGLEHQLGVCIFSFGHRLAKAARATGVEHTLD